MRRQYRLGCFWGLVAGSFRQGDNRISRSRYHNAFDDYLYMNWFL